MPRQLPLKYPKVFLTVALTWLLALTAAHCHAEPAASLRYRADFIREGRAVWGLNGPIATMAAQVQQESRWNAKVCSAFACGLAQFTPQTAKWISGVYSKQLGTGNVYDPAWAMRALFLYDHMLWSQVPPAREECSRWAFTLSSYNGGLGWLNRDVHECLVAGEGGEGGGSRGVCKPDAWFRNVELSTARSRSAAEENRHYPEVILTTQAEYDGWGEEVECSTN